MLKIATALFLLIFSAMAKAQYYHENAAGFIVLPTHFQDSSYFKMAQEDKFRFDELLGFMRSKNTVPDDLVHTYGRSLSEYQRATQLIGGDITGTKEKLETSFRAINDHLGNLQKNHPEVFEEFAEQNSGIHSLKSSDPEGTPDFCRYFPQIYQGDQSAYFTGPGLDPNVRVYATCRENQLFTVNLQDVIDIASNLDNRRLQPQEQKAKDQLMGLVGGSVLSHMNSYHGLFGRSASLPMEIKNCGEQKKNHYPAFAETLKVGEKNLESSSEVDQAEIEFELFHSMMALKASAFFEKRSELKIELDKVRNQRSRSRDVAKNREIRETRQAARDSLSAKLAIIDLQIEKMFEEAPLLFKIENETNLSELTFVNMQIRPSEFLNSITPLIPNNDVKIRDFKTVIDSHLDSNQLGEKLAERSESILDQLEPLTQEGAAKLKIASQQAIDGHLKELGNSLLQICENEGEYLHHHSALYPTVLDHVSQIGDPNLAKQNLLETQAGICSLYRKDPPGDSRGSLAYYGGMAMIAGGLATSVFTGWTGIGAAAGVGIMTAGGGILTADQYQEYQNARLRATNAEAMLSTPWGEVRQALEAKEAQTTAGIMTAIEGASTLTGVPLIRMASKLRAISSARLSPKTEEVATNLLLKTDDRVASVSRYTSVENPSPTQIQGVLDAHNTGTPLILQGNAAIAETDRLAVLNRYLGGTHSADEIASIASQGTITRKNHLDLEAALKTAGASDQEIADALYRVGYSAQDLAEKRRILIESGFSIDDANNLIRAGVTGGKQAPYGVVPRNDFGTNALLIRENLEKTTDYRNMTTHSANAKPPISVYIGDGDPIRLSVTDATTVGIGRMREFSRKYLDENNLAAASEAARVESEIATDLAKYMRDHGSNDYQRQRYAMEAVVSRGVYRRLSGRSGNPIDETTVQFLRESGYSDSLTPQSLDNLTDHLRKPESYGSTAKLGENLRKYAETIELLRAHRHVLSTAGRNNDYAAITASHSGSLATSPTERARMVQLIDEKLRLLEMAEERLFQRLN